jgi:SAM-dependent methyltransferase
LHDASLDFAYSLGVLHHMPDTQGAIRAIARKLKPGAPLLLYLYYAFDGRPFWFRALWKLSDRARRLLSRQPPTIKNLATDAIAALVYWPLARVALALEKLGVNSNHWPL